MGGRTGTCRKLGAALALWGILLYSALIPGHVVSQLIAALIQAKLGDATTMLCHSDESAPAKPNTQDEAKHCPFCTGAAAFQLASFSPPSLIVPPSDLGSETLAVENEAALLKSILTPQSRGPPSLPV